MELFTIENNRKTYNAEACFKYLAETGRQFYGRHFTLHKSDYPVIMKLLQYAIYDEEGCTEKGIELRKGILLIGPVGCGKTSLMNLIRPFFDENRRHLIKPTRDITYEFMNEGYPTIYKYGKSHKVYCFDDLGVEQNHKHYGNECNTMAEIMLTRYDNMIHSKVPTHATTNLNADELEKMYGNRVRSRLREMFNLIAFDKDSPDKRK